MPKKTPLRMCVACRQMREKKELTRVVRSPEGEARIDGSGRANGRGAYLCRETACLEKAKKSRALERALEVGLSAELWDALKETVVDAGGR